MLGAAISANGFWIEWHKDLFESPLLHPELDFMIFTNSKSLTFSCINERPRSLSADRFILLFMNAAVLRSLSSVIAAATMNQLAT